MTFFNKKTEVMKVQLTPFGRYKLSVGKLKPHHYRFFDNNVIYDGKSMGITEAQNDSDNRIRQETPVLKQNANITGVETGISILGTDDLRVQLELPGEQNSIGNKSNDRQNKRDDHINQMSYNIGSVPPNTRQSPSYQVDAFLGKLSGSTNKFYSSANIQTASIAQINLKIQYEASITNSFLEAISYQDDVTTIGPFADGSRIVIKKQDPLLRIKQSNSFDEKENFHITAFKVYTEPGVADGRLLYEKMNFRKRRSNIVSNMYVDPGEAEEIEPIDSLDLSVREIPYYFDVLVDKEIAEEDYCKTIGELPIKNIYLDHEIICPDQQGGPLNNYSSPVSPDDLEDCD